MDYREVGKSNRQDWEFDYTAKELREACAKQKAHREDRLAWWEAKKAEVMQEVKDSGIEVSESLAASYSSLTNMAGRGPQVMIKTELQEQLNECHTRMTKHANMIREYDAWLQILNAMPDTKSLVLKQGDWLFFFGK